MQEQSNCACGCGQPTSKRVRRRDQTKRYRQGHNSKHPLLPPFWPRVNQTGDCWEWTGARQNKGYGAIRFRTPDGTFHTAHRYAYYLTHGPIPDGHVVRHRCDNPLCCRPDHLFLGTQIDNINDMLAKRRNPRGERIGNSKLTATDVQEIRDRLKHERPAVIAGGYGVSRATIERIAVGINWTEQSPHS